MTWKIFIGRAVLAGVGGVLILGGSSSGTAQTQITAVGRGPGVGTAANDAQIEADVSKALDSPRFKEVKSSVRDGVITLTGTVGLYSDKLDADNRAHHRKNVRGVENEIAVTAPPVEDVTLRDRLAEKLAYDRVGYGTTAFNALTIAVESGVVTLGGTAYGPMDKDSAVSLVENFPGVKDVIDNIDVSPVSPVDDKIRLAEARAIYGAPQLNKYAIDPAKPIRITVVRGAVTLSGVVDNQADKDVANLRANSVPGVSKIVNNLQIVSDTEERQQRNF